MQNEIIDFLIECLEKNSDLPEMENILEFNYISAGYIDSIALVQFVAEIEDEYNIEFTNDELQSDDFKVVGSLSEMIRSKIKH